MDTTTERYIKVRKIYKDKHEADCKAIISKIHDKFGGENVEESLISDYINQLSNLEVV